MKEVLKQLNGLKNIKPDQAWRERNRSVLLSQISSGSTVGEFKSSRWDVFRAGSLVILEKLEQPVLATILLFGLLATGMLAGVSASRDTKPGDSLYIAKKLNERLRASITFDETEKLKLNLEFASNRAEEIKEVARSEDQTKEEKISGLADDFKNEIKTVKNRLTKIKTGAAVSPAPVDDKVFGANLGKDNSRLEISQQPLPKTAEEIITEAEELFDKKDYEGTLNKLEEINSVIAQSEPAPEAADTATSTK